MGNKIASMNMMKRENTRHEIRLNAPIRRNVWEYPAGYYDTHYMVKRFRYIWPVPLAIFLIISEEIINAWNKYRVLLDLMKI